jgi:hypothetical protein
MKSRRAEKGGETVKSSFARSHEKAGSRAPSSCAEEEVTAAARTIACLRTQDMKERATTYISAHCRAQFSRPLNTPGRCDNSVRVVLTDARWVLQISRSAVSRRSAWRVRLRCWSEQRWDGDRSRAQAQAPRADWAQQLKPSGG